MKIKFDQDDYLHSHYCFQNDAFNRVLYTIALKYGNFPKENTEALNFFESEIRENIWIRIKVELYMHLREKYENKI